MVDSWLTTETLLKALENDSDGLTQGYIDACRTGVDSGRKYLEGLDIRQQIQLKKRLGYTPEMFLADFPFEGMVEDFMGDTDDCV